jgi:FkbM family methyltransferase
MKAFHELITSTLRPYPFRGKLRLLDALVPEYGVQSAQVFRALMQLDVKDPIQRNIYLGTYEPQETIWVEQWLKPGMTFVDIGANVGYFTALAARRVGSSGRLFAVEPQPHVYRKLRQMIEDNSLSQVTAICAGLSDAPGILPLFLPADACFNNATMVRHEGARSIEVPVKTLDTCLDEWGVERIDLLKIDVEGHEPSVFRGAASALAAGKIRAILCEFNDPWLRLAGSSAGELHSQLLRAGFVDRQGTPKFAGPLENRFLCLKQ